MAEVRTFALSVKLSEMKVVSHKFIFLFLAICLLIFLSGGYFYVRWIYDFRLSSVAHQLPQYPGSTKWHYIESLWNLPAFGGNGPWVDICFVSSDNADQVIKFYKGELPKSGFSVTGTKNGYPYISGLGSEFKDTGVKSDYDVISFYDKNFSGSVGMGFAFISLGDCDYRISFHRLRETDLEHINESWWN